MERLSRWKVDLFCTDNWGVYSEVIAADKLYQSKSQTVYLEQNNGRQRHWFARFRRKSIVVSKTLEMVDLTIALFARFHINGRRITMIRKDEEWQGIARTLRSKVLDSILHISAVSLNSFLMRLDKSSHIFLLSHLTSKKFPFSRRGRNYPQVKIQFNINKALKILKIKDYPDDFPLELRLHLKDNIAARLEENLYRYRSLLFKNNTKQPLVGRKDVEDRTLHNNFTNALIGPARNLEYGHLGIPSLKPDTYKLKYRHK